MLFDAVLASKMVSQSFGENFGGFQREMRGAQRFDLSLEFAAAADEIVRSNTWAQHTAKQLVRPPYATTWWEVAHAFRPGFTGELDAQQFVPHRVGVLARTFEDAPSAFHMDLFYAPRRGDAVPCLVSVACDLNAPGVVSDDGVGFAGVDNPFMSTVLAKWLQERPQRADAESKNWFGEIRYWPVAMMLLNSRNIAYAEPGLPRKRRGADKQLPPFHTCRVRLDRIGRRSARDGQADAASVRAHFVRGHFKVRAGGIYWWRPFVRGDVKKGFVGKAYEIQGGS